MSTLFTHAKPSRESEQALVRVVQIGCFFGGLALLPLCVSAATRFAASPFEVFVGVVLAGILAISMVVLGLVIPSAMLSRST